MADVIFFASKYTIDSLVSHYLEDIKKLRVNVKNPSDETKLQTYYQAANTFKRISTKELFQFAMSYGREASGKSAAMRTALPILIGNRITQPSALDLAYLQLLLIYVKQFKTHRKNIKEWTLRFLLGSQFSPIYSMINSEINNVIANTEHNIRALQGQR